MSLTLNCSCNYTAIIVLVIMTFHLAEVVEWSLGKIFHIYQPVNKECRIFFSIKIWKYVKWH